MIAGEMPFFVFRDLLSLHLHNMFLKAHVLKTKTKTAITFP